MDRRAELHEAMSLLAQGDREAFEVVYAIAWPMVRRFTLRALPGAEDAEDTAQAVLLKMFEQASDFDPERGAAASWALSIAAYECRTVRKRRARRREVAPCYPDLRLDDAPSPESRMITQDLSAAALEALGTLRPGDIETILGKLQGERPEGVGGATLRKRTQRAFERLRSAWRRRYGVE